jgi:hypothetical protein
VTSKVGHGPTERAAQDEVRRLCQLKNHDPGFAIECLDAGVTRWSSRWVKP